MCKIVSKTSSSLDGQIDYQCVALVLTVSTLALTKFFCRVIEKNGWYFSGHDVCEYV